MASFECDFCGVRYPHNMKFQDCPNCGDRCRQIKADPNVSREEASRRLALKETYAAFEAWCEENQRRPADVPACYIELPEDGDGDDGRYAMEVAWMLEEAFPTYCLGALYVL